MALSRWKQSRCQNSELKGAKRLSGGGAKFENKHKSYCFKKSKLVDWGGGGGQVLSWRRFWVGNFPPVENFNKSSGKCLSIRINKQLANFSSRQKTISHKNKILLQKSILVLLWTLFVTINYYQQRHCYSLFETISNP